MKNLTVALLLVALCNHLSSVIAFGGSTKNPSFTRASPSLVKLRSSQQGNDLKTEAAQLLEKVRLLRESLPAEREKKTPEFRVKRTSPWTVPDSDIPGVGYRLYIDVGREEGSWMDQRWGASGKRIEFSVDVKFLLNRIANQTIVDRMVKDNFGGSSSPTYELQTSPMARLRSGFDEMACHGGGYRMDTGRNGAGTVRFHILVDGTPETESSYGYVSNGMTLVLLSECIDYFVCI